METSKVILYNSAKNVPLRDIQTGFGPSSNFVKKYEIFKQVKRISEHYK